MGYLAQDTGLASQATVWEEMLGAFATVRQMEQRMRTLEIAISEADPAADSGNLLKEYDQLQHEFAEKNGYGYENEIRSVLHGFQFDPSLHASHQYPFWWSKTRLALAKMLLQNLIS